MAAMQMGHRSYLKPPPMKSVMLMGLCPNLSLSYRFHFFRRGFARLEGAWKLSMCAFLQVQCSAAEGTVVATTSEPEPQPRCATTPPPALRDTASASTSPVSPPAAESAP